MAYSIPYFYDGGIGGITKRPDVLEKVRRVLRDEFSPGQSEGPTTADPLRDLTIAVQNDTAAHHYAAANLSGSRLIVCDSLPAAFEYADSSVEPGVDVILGAQPVLTYMVSKVRKDWASLARQDGRPVRFTKAQYAVVMAEESYRLRWLVNDVLFRLEEAGRLQDMRKRWLEDDYAYPRRASMEGLAFDAEKMVTHYMQGTCRVESRD